ncbi:hypothetical protein D3C72_1884120 [compost metagenome]
MATKPVKTEPRVPATGNDEIRGRALVAHIDAKLARGESLNQHDNTVSSRT